MGAKQIAKHDQKHAILSRDLRDLDSMFSISTKIKCFFAVADLMLMDENSEFSLRFC